MFTWFYMKFEDKFYKLFRISLPAYELQYKGIKFK